MIKKNMKMKIKRKRKRKKKRKGKRKNRKNTTKQISALAKYALGEDEDGMKRKFMFSLKWVPNLAPFIKYIGKLIPHFSYYRFLRQN